MTTLSILHIEQAINFWRTVHPSTSKENVLAPEVNALADTYASMIFNKRCEIDVKELPPAQQDALATFFAALASDEADATPTESPAP